MILNTRRLEFKDFQQKEGKLKDESHQLDDIDRQFQNQTAKNLYNFKIGNLYLYFSVEWNY